MTPIIHSLLETDLYKFTMWQALLHRQAQAQAQAEYRFVCRIESTYPLAELLGDVNAQLDHLCSLAFTEDELGYIGGLRYIKNDFVDFLRIFRFQRRFIEARAQGNGLSIVANGPNWSAATASRSPNSPTRRARRCAPTRPFWPTCARSSVSNPEGPRHVDDHRRPVELHRRRH